MWKLCATLPPLHPAAASCRAVQGSCGELGCSYERAGQDWLRASRLERRQRLRVRIAHGRGFSQRIPAVGGRQRAAPETKTRICRESPVFQPLRDAGKWGVAVSENFATFAAVRAPSRLRADRGSLGRRAVLRLGAKELRTTCEGALILLTSFKHGTQDLSTSAAPLPL